MKTIRRSLADESGATAIEYGLNRRWHCPRDYRRREWPRHQAEHKFTSINSSLK
jgi:hypothetical protein